MKNVKKLFVIAILIGFSAISFAQVGATAQVSAKIITPITISKITDMAFGNVAISPVIDGTVILTTINSRSRTAGVILPAITGIVSAAKFTVTGLAGSIYTISMPTSIILKKGADQMTVDNFTRTPTAGGTLSGTGTEDIFVGGTLNVIHAQPAGTYVNTTDLIITVNYN